MTEPMQSGEIARFTNEAVQGYDGAGFSDWFSDADVKVGYDLISDREELFDELVGVPFGIMRVVFRPGNRNPVTKRLGAYASLECMIADEPTLQRIHRNLDNKPFNPGDLFVINDGSTGIYRDVVKYLHGKEYIKLPDPLVEVGPSGSCSYDLRPDEWADIYIGSGHGDENGFVHYSANVKIFCPRGIRISDGYSNEWTTSGKTRYIA